MSAATFIRGSGGPRQGSALRLDARPAPLDFDPARAALVVVDMQNDFLHPLGWFPASGVDPAPLLGIVPTIEALARDVRDAGGKVVWLNWGVTPGAPEVPPTLKRKAGLNGKRPTYGDPAPSGNGHVLVRGDWGSRTIDALPAAPGDILVHKHRLTGFYDNELDSVLRNAGIETLLFAGVNTDRCVFETLCDASVRGYACVLVEDACATSSPDFVRDAVLFLVPLLHGACATAADVFAALSQPASPDRQG